MQMNKNTMITFQILLLLLTVIAPLVAAQEPEYPMILSGTVTNNDADEGIPEGTIIITRDSKTGIDVGSTTVNDNGDFGDRINNKLIINECKSFDLYIVFGETEIKVGTYPWDNKATDPLDIWYSKDTDTGTGNDYSDGTAGSSFRSPESTSTAVAGGAGLELSPDSTLTGTPTLETESTSLTDEENKYSLPLVIALLVIILIIAYFGYKKIQ